MTRFPEESGNGSVFLKLPAVFFAGACVLRRKLSCPGQMHTAFALQRQKRHNPINY